MGLCVKCRLNVCTPCVPVQGEAANDNVGIVRIAHNRVLLRPQHYQYLAWRLAGIDVSSRGYLDWLADRLFFFEGTILDRDGSPLELGDTAIDDAFGDEPSARWVRSFRAAADKGLKQTPQRKLLPRLRLIDLGFQIADVGTARAYGR